MRVVSGTREPSRTTIRNAASRALLYNSQAPRNCGSYGFSQAAEAFVEEILIGVHDRGPIEVQGQIAILDFDLLGLQIAQLRGGVDLLRRAAAVDDRLDFLQQHAGIAPQLAAEIVDPQELGGAVARLGAAPVGQMQLLAERIVGRRAQLDHLAGGAAAGQDDQRR